MQWNNYYKEIICFLVEINITKIIWVKVCKIYKNINNVISEIPNSEIPNSEIPNSEIPKENENICTYFSGCLWKTRKIYSKREK